MKTKRRHELQTNDLADWIGGQIETVGPYFRAIVASVVAIVVAVGMYFYFSHRATTRQEQIWEEYFTALDEYDRSGNVDTGLRDIVEQCPEKLVGDCARLSLADAQLSKGIDQLFSNRADARTELRAAVANYLEVIQGDRDAALVEHATLGLGRAHESLNNLEEARGQYRRLIEKWPGGAYASEAQRRLDDLDRATTKSFYDWFVRREPKSSYTNEPGIPGMKPEFDPDSLSFDEMPFFSGSDSSPGNTRDGTTDSAEEDSGMGDSQPPDPFLTPPTPRTSDPQSRSRDEAPSEPRSTTPPDNEPGSAPQP